MAAVPVSAIIGITAVAHHFLLPLCHRHLHFVLPFASGTGWLNPS